MFRTISKSPTSPTPSPSPPPTKDTGTKITYDSTGKVVSSTYLKASDIPNLAISQITDLQSTLDALGILAATPETDPIFLASPASSITQLDIDGWVVGPAVATDNAVARYDTTTGKLLQNSAVTISDNGVLTITATGFVQLAVNSSGTSVFSTFTNSTTGNTTIGMGTSGGQLTFNEFLAPSATTTSRNRINFTNFHTTPHAAGNVLGSLMFYGSRNNATSFGARISAFADGAYTISSAPAYITFNTSPTGAVVPVERLRIASTGETQLRGGYGLRLYDSDNTNYVSFVPAATGSLASDLSFTLPFAHGTAGYPLTNNGSGTLSFSQIDAGAIGSGTLPVARGGTGATTFTNNRILTGNGTSAIVDETNLTFDGTTLTLTGRLAQTSTATSASSLNSASITSTLTGTANSLTFKALDLTGNFNNDGVVTGQSLVGQYGTYNFGNTTAATQGTAIGNYTFATNYGTNVSQLTGVYVRMDERAASGDLSTRFAGRFDVQKYIQSGDVHTMTGIQGQVIDQTGVGRIKTGYGLNFAASNCLTGYGANIGVANTRLTGNTQYGVYTTLTTSGAGVTTTNAYGNLVNITTASSGAITNAYSVFSNSATTGITNPYFLYNTTSWRNYLNGNLAIGVDDYTSAKVVIRGTGTTSSTYSLFAENSAGTDYFKLNDAGQLYLGASTPNASAILQADSTTQGFLQPRMTTAQRDAIGTPAAGLTIYNTTTKKLNLYTTVWEEVPSADFSQNFLLMGA